MENIRILHNPESGDSLYSKEVLAEYCDRYGFTWSYYSLKEPGWDQYSEKDEMLLLCGGDGSVQKVLESLLDKERVVPIALIPGGTANNISKSLPQYCLENFRAVATEIPKLDYGTVSGSSPTPFFIESYGIGLLPQLIKKMSDHDSGGMNSDEKIEAARNELLQIIREYSGVRCQINTNDGILEDTFLMVEVLNTPSVGPNLILVDDCNPTDGKLNLVTVTVAERANFESYLCAVMDGHTAAYQPTSILTDQVNIEWAKGTSHADDEPIGETSDGSCTIQLHKEMFPIFVVKT